MRTYKSVNLKERREAGSRERGLILCLMFLSVLFLISSGCAAGKKAGSISTAQGKKSLPTKVADASKAQEEGAGVQINDIEISQDENGQEAVVIQLTDSAPFLLKRTAPSEYVLTFSGVALKPNMQSSLINENASQSSIKSVRVVPSGDLTEVRIFVKPQVALKALPQGKKMVKIAALPITEAVKQEGVEAAQSAEGSALALPPEARAQLKEEGEKKNEEAKKGEGAEGQEKALPDEGADQQVEGELEELLGEEKKYTGRKISLDLQDTDIDNALRIIAEVSNLNIIASEEVTGKVTLRLIDVPWDQALDVILRTHGLDKVQEGNVIRIAPVEKLRAEREALKQAKEAEEELEPLKVKYFRISYARASDLKALVDTVLSERGSATYDERTNQLIVQDISRGLANAERLIRKLDLRTPQVLLETQIVEGQSSIVRDLGSQFGFALMRSPQTGNPTGYNFPNSIAVGGGNGNGNFSSFPVSGGGTLAVVLDSADGATNIDLALSALEEEGRVKIISKPSVVTTNSEEAVIKSVERIRVKLPSGGTSVATGAGATASAATSVATEQIEIGIVLTVTPYASPDYYVLLDVKAKSSTLGSTIVDGIPSEVERSATSTVLVASGQTFALGGIYKITNNDKVSGVPFFKDIPVLGHLFRRAGINNSDEELIFFITPRIVPGSFDDAAMKF